MDPYENIELWASKQQGDWSQLSVASQINRERLEALKHVFPKGKLDNMVKVRLLLACAFLPLQQLSELHAELSALADTARSDDDEWVRVVAAAVGNLDGQLDMASVTSASSLVYQSLDGLWAGLAGATPPSGYRPLQEVLMHPDVRPPLPFQQRTHTAHFSVRDTDEAHETLAVSNPDNLLGLPGGSSGAMSLGAATAGRGGMAGAGESSLFISRPPPPQALAPPGGAPRHLGGGAVHTASMGDDMDEGAIDDDEAHAIGELHQQDEAGVAGVEVYYDDELADLPAEPEPEPGAEDTQADVDMGDGGVDVDDPSFDDDRDGKRPRLADTHRALGEAAADDAEEI